MCPRSRFWLQRYVCGDVAHWVCWANRMTFFKLGNRCINLDAVTYVDIQPADDNAATQAGIFVYFVGTDTPLSLLSVPTDHAETGKFLKTIGYVKANSTPRVGFD
jgi:hypothetical protein